jgi:hypothetical protein
MDYTWKNEDNSRSNLLHALEVLEAVKMSTQKLENVNSIKVFTSKLGKCHNQSGRYSTRTR